MDLLRHFLTTENRPLVKKVKDKKKDFRPHPPHKVLDSVIRNNLGLNEQSVVLPSNLTDLSEGGLEVFFPLDSRPIVSRIWVEKKLKYHTLLRTSRTEVKSYLFSVLKVAEATSTNLVEQ